MKKLVCTFLSLAMMLAMFTAMPLTAQAATYTTTVDGIKYTIDTKEGTATVTGWEGSITTADILSEVDGYAVTSIGDYAFRYCYALTSVKIGNSVTTIGAHAFGCCNSLTSVTIGNAVTTISESAFGRCESLAEVTIPDSVTSIGYRSFDWCTSLKSITIGDGLTSIGDYAFEGSSAIKSVYIKDLTAWCNIDFGRDTSNPLFSGANLYLSDRIVKKLEIPYGVTEIKKNAFRKCNSIC